LKLSKGRLIKFLIVGASGVMVNYIIYFPAREIIAFDLIFLTFKFHIDFMWLVGIGVSAISNYILNEFWTFNKPD
jgi:putative flippase GtrA